MDDLIQKSHVAAVLTMTVSIAGFASTVTRLFEF